MSRNLKRGEGLSHAAMRELRFKAARRACTKALREEFLRSTRG